MGTELQKRKENAVATRSQTVKKTLFDNRKRIQTALHDRIDPNVFIASVLKACEENSKLMDCTPDSLMQACYDLSEMGLQPGGPVPEAYVYPYGNVATAVPSYRGLIKLARRSGEIKTVVCELVHDGDEFAYSPVAEPPIVHVPATDKGRSQRPVTHVYCLYVLKDGGYAPSVWTAADVDAHKEKYSQAWRRAEQKQKDSPWHTAWGAMAKKTVLTDPIKRGLVPLSLHERAFAQRTMDDPTTTTVGGIIDAEPKKQIASPEASPYPEEWEKGLHRELSGASTVEELEAIRERREELCSTAEDRNALLDSIEDRRRQLTDEMPTDR